MEKVDRIFAALCFGGFLILLVVVGIVLLYSMIIADGRYPLAAKTSGEQPAESPPVEAVAEEPAPPGASIVRAEEPPPPPSVAGYVRVLADGPILTGPGGDVVGHARVGEVFSPGQTAPAGEWWTIRICSGEDRYIRRSDVTGAEGLPILHSAETQKAIWRRIRPTEDVDAALIDRQALEIFRIYRMMPAWCDHLVETFGDLAPEPPPPPRPTFTLKPDTYVRAKTRAEIRTEPVDGLVLGHARPGDVFRSADGVDGDWRSIYLVSGQDRWIRSTAVAETTKPSLPRKQVREILFSSMPVMERESDDLAFARYPNARTEAEFLVLIAYQRELWDKAALTIFQIYNTSTALYGDIAFEGIREDW